MKLGIPCALHLQRTCNAQDGSGKEELNVMPRQLDCIGVVPSFRMHEVKAVVDGAVRVTLRVEIVKLYVDRELNCSRYLVT